LIDAGVEDATANGKVAVIAVPGTSFPSHWAEHFRFRHIILCGDRDEPGQNAVRKVGELLLPLAESVRVFSWAGIDPASNAGDIRELYQIIKPSRIV
jgi:DNA primase